MKRQKGKKVQKNPETSSHIPLCREPWENYYILRRGIIPCCYGNESVAPMPGWEEGWNSPQLQEIRRYLSQGKLSPYCKRSPSCPIVQRLTKENKGVQSPVQKMRVRLSFINRLFFRIPGKIYRALRK